MLLLKSLYTRHLPLFWWSMLSQEGPCCHTSMLIVTLMITESFPTESG